MNKLLAAVVLTSYLGLVGTTSLAIAQAGGHRWQVAFVLPAGIGAAVLTRWVRRQARRV
jgi:hypothetical protein